MLPPLLRAVVLRTRPFSETSLWIRLYTESHGKLTGIGKGARRGTERIFTPFLEVEVRGYPPRAPEHGLWTLARPEVARDWRDLVSDPERMAWGFALLELVDITVEELHPQPDLYADLVGALEGVHAQPSACAPAVFLWFALKLADRLGYTLQYDICPRCERPLVFPVGALVAAAGGVLCRRCSPAGTTPLQEDAWELLVTLAAAPAAPALATPSPVRDRLLSLLVEYLSHHSEKAVRLRALGLLTE